MAWRLKRSEWEKGKGESNRRLLQNLSKQEISPGLLAYLDDSVAGWCSIGPRENFLALKTSRTLAPVDSLPVWSITCLFVSKPFRRQGLSSQLIEAAVRFAKRHGAKIVEGYPVVPYSENMPSAFAWTGTEAAFIKAGFVEVARRSPSKPIMRRVLKN